VKIEILQRIKEGMNILSAMKKRRDNWIFHIMRRKCFLKDVIEEKVEGKGRGGGRHKQILHDLNPLTPELNPPRNAA
jgi:hypothetical protein